MGCANQKADYFDEVTIKQSNFPSSPAQNTETNDTRSPQSQVSTPPRSAIMTPVSAPMKEFRSEQKNKDFSGSKLQF